MRPFAAAAAWAVPGASGGATRTETDLLGPKEVPVDAFYGIATQRAAENYDITGVRLNHFPEFIVALAITKKAWEGAPLTLTYTSPPSFVAAYTLEAP